jgi:PAS domain S-box-containing protein
LKGGIRVNTEQINILQLKRKLEEYEQALTLLSECIVGVNEKGNITFISRSYSELLGFENPDSLIGKHCTEVIENSKLHEIVKTGQSEIGHIHYIRGKEV